MSIFIESANYDYLSYLYSLNGGKTPGKQNSLTYINKIIVFNKISFNGKYNL